MDIFVARQPIFDRRMHVYGYELLYRHSSQNTFSGIDDKQATGELIYNSFLVVGIQSLTEGTKAFINFSKDHITEKLPSILPPQSVVIEVLERGKATKETVKACQQLREMGYTIALDDFVLDQDNIALTEVADIIKVEFPAVSFERQKRLLQKYQPQIKFVAEKIETREEYQWAHKMGYDFFQGYFFSKPAIIASKEIKSLPINIINILGELNKPNPDFATISAIVERDVGLSYKLLKIVNAVYYGLRYKVTTIIQAVAYIGIHELQQWMAILMVKELRNPENAELIKLCVIRSKFMELISWEIKATNLASDYFFTGLFSFLDVLMNKPMEEALKDLPLADKVKQALLGEKNEYRECLNFVTSCERVTGDYKKSRISSLIDSKRFMELYIEALDWAKKVNI